MTTIRLSFTDTFFQKGGCRYSYTPSWLVKASSKSLWLSATYCKKRVVSLLVAIWNAHFSTVGIVELAMDATLCAGYSGLKSYTYLVDWCANRNMIGQIPDTPLGCTQWHLGSCSWVLLSSKLRSSGSSMVSKVHGLFSSWSEIRQCISCCASLPKPCIFRACWYPLQSHLRRSIHHHRGSLWYQWLGVI